MSKVNDILAELVIRLNKVANAQVEQGFYASYQSEDLNGKRLLVLQVISDGPCVHKQGTHKTPLTVAVFAAIEFNEQANDLLLALLQEIRKAIFPKERFAFNRLVHSIIETEPTPLRPPKEGQDNAYLALPLTIEYIESEFQ